MGFQVIPDSTYSSSKDNNMFSWFSNREKVDDITTDTFYRLVEIISNPYLKENARLDSMRYSKFVEPALLAKIESDINIRSLNEIVTTYYYGKILQTEKERNILLENLAHAGIVLKDGNSPMTLEKYKREGYPLDQLIAELQGYERMIINLEEIKYEQVIIDIFKLAFPEFDKQPLKIKVNKSDIDIEFNKTKYKLNLEIINNNPESSLHYKSYFITQYIKDFITQIFIDFDIKRKIGILPLSRMRDVYRNEQIIDTFMISVYDQNTGIKKENFQVGLSFHDSLKIVKQLKLKHFYFNDYFENSSLNLNYDQYLKSRKLKEFQELYIKVGKNNSYMQKVMQEAANELHYPMHDYGRLTAFFFKFYLDESEFIPKFLIGDAFDNEKIDIVSNFETAFPEINNLLARKLSINNISQKKYNDAQYEIQLVYKGKKYTISGTLEDIGIGCAKIIDQILASEKNLGYRIYTSLEKNYFYKELIILRNDELAYFKNASGISPTTLTP